MLTVYQLSLVCEMKLLPVVLQFCWRFALCFTDLLTLKYSYTVSLFFFFLSVVFRYLVMYSSIWMYNLHHNCYLLFWDHKLGETVAGDWKWVRRFTPAVPLHLALNYWSVSREMSTAHAYYFSQDWSRLIFHSEIHYIYIFFFLECSILIMSLLLTE